MGNEAVEELMNVRTVEAVVCKGSKVSQVSTGASTSFLVAVNSF